MDFDQLPPFVVRPGQRVFLGHDPAASWRRRWTAEPRDSVAVVGPPGYGKTAGVIIPALLSWSGPVVSTSTRGDVLAATGAARQRLAGEHGGRVYVYDPFASEPGVVSVRWSPLAGCEDASVAYRRAGAMTAAAGQGIADADHWRTGAAAILRGLFHAAALAQLPLREVRRWLAGQETGEPADILRQSQTAATGWADDLRAVDRLGDRERGSFYSVARIALDATADPRVLAASELSELDIDQFLRTCSTLYIVGPGHVQEAVAPLIVGLVDAIAQRAAELAAADGGRLDPGLLLALDELANIAPLRSLPSLVSEGGGRGITTLWAVQSLAQVRARYGVDGQQAILAATTAKLIYGGMSNGGDLHDVSGWAGDYRAPAVTWYAGEPADWRRSPAIPGRLTDRHDTGREHAVSSVWRPVLEVGALQMLPPLQAWLFYRSDAPLLVHTPPAGLVPSYRGLLGPAAIGTPS